MFMKMRNFGACLLLLTLLFSSCGNYNKVLKSTDYEFKLKKAIEYYGEGQFVKSGTLLQELLSIYRGTSKADKVYYYYAKSMIGQKDYLMAAHYFSTLVKEFPTSQYVEEAQYMIGYCDYLLSPNYRLDQSVTHEAIDALQLYINLYPYSNRVEEANRLIDELNAKLEEKSYQSAILYYKFGDYKAAVVALGDCLKEYPDTKYREDLMFKLLESRYILAMHSVESKKEQRLSAALDEYFSFADEFPKSEHMKDAKKYYDTLSKLLNYKADNINANK